MRIDFNTYATIYTDDACIFNVSFIIIDDKVIDANDSNGFPMASIYYKKAKEIGCFHYDDDERLNEIIVKNGELQI